MRKSSSVYVDINRGPAFGTECDSVVEKAEIVGEDLTNIRIAMNENFSNLVKKEEHLQRLKEETELLVRTSQLFQKRSTATKRSLWWKNASFKLLLVLIAICIIAGLFFMKATGLTTTLF